MCAPVYSTPCSSGPIGRGKWIEGEHLQPESAQDLRSNAPDFAGTENTGSLAVQVEADKPAEREVEVMHAVTCARNLAIEREQQRYGVLCDGVRRIAGTRVTEKPSSFAAARSMPVESSAPQRYVCLSDRATERTPTIPTIRGTIIL